MFRSLLFLPLVVVCTALVAQGAPGALDPQRTAEKERRFAPTGSPAEFLNTDLRTGIVTTIDRNGMHVRMNSGTGGHARFLPTAMGRGALAPLGQALLTTERPAELIFQHRAIAVQYLLEDAGVRQNFLIQERPSGQGDLRVALALRTDLRAELAGPGAIHFHDVSGKDIHHYEDLRVWDANGTPLQARAELLEDGERIELVVADAKAVYPVTIDPISTVPNASLIGLVTSGEFGFSVATAGDLNGDGFSDVVVGARGATLGQTGEGAAYVYYGSVNGISAAPSVVLQSDQVQAGFGSSVGTAGDVNGDGYADLAVGAWRWDNVNLGDQAGGVFIYYGSATGISTVADQLLAPPGNHAGDFFGANIACAGDINNDGFSDLIVGAYLASYGQTEEGVAFIYMGSATGLSATPAHRLERNNGASHFSRSVSSAGDVNRDGYSDVVIGCSRWDNVYNNDGAAFVYYGGPNGLGLGFNPNPSIVLYGDGTAESNFGWSVSVAGDTNGDGYSDIVVGAYRDENGQTDEGTAWIFYGSATGLSQSSYTKVESNQAGAWFGRSVSTAGDMNGDGFADVMVGATLFGYGEVQEGVAFLYLGSAAGVSTTVATYFQINVTGAHLGESCGVAGDVNGDGYSDVIVGADAYYLTGAAFVFHGGPRSISTIPTYQNDGTTANGHRGKRVSSAGDVNGDGYVDVLVSAPDEGSGGMVHVFHGSPGGLSATPNLSISGSAVGAAPQFGLSLCTAGDVNGDGYSDVIIGAPLSGGGKALIFHGSPGGLSAVPALTLTQPLSQFGYSVSTAGDINSDGYSDVVVGSNGAGATVHLGTAAGIAPALHASLTGANTGRCVSTAGDVNGDGYSDIIIAQNSGAFAQVFHGAQTGLITLPAVTIPVINSSGLGVSHFTDIQVCALNDVNGDGFDDVAIGAPYWEDNAAQVDEGLVSVFYGSALGTMTSGNSIIQRNQAGGAFGASICGAGDPNGDGYADLVAGIPNYVLGQVEEGGVLIFNGRNGPINPGAILVVQGNQDYAHLGASVAGVGDIDGDGYSDVVMGAPDRDGLNTDQGGFFVSYGNEATGIMRLTRQYQADLVSPLATNCMDFSDPNNFGIGHFARSPIHRTKARMHWEVVFEGQAFSGSPITSGQGNTGVSAAWMDLGSGMEIKQLIYKTPNYIRYKWRVRLEYDLAKLVDGQRFSRWFYGYANGYGDIGVLPVELLGLEGHATPEGNRLAWATATEMNSLRFDVERSRNGSDFVLIGSVAAAGNSMTLSDYGFLDADVQDGIAYYRLRMIDLDGAEEFSPVVAVQRSSGNGVLLYPVPALDVLTIRTAGDQGGVLNAVVLDAIGRTVLRSTLDLPPGATQATLGVADLPTGAYTLVLEGPTGILHRAPFLKD